MEYLLEGHLEGRVPDLVRLRGRDWCPSVYREPDEASESFWARIMTVARMLRAESIESRPLPDGEPFRFVMTCSYGVPYVDPEEALRVDLLDATKWRLRRLMESRASTPEVQVQAATMMGTLLLAEGR